MGLFFNPYNDSFHVNRVPQSVSDLQDHLAALKYEKQQLLALLQRKNIVAEEIKTEVEKANLGHKANLKMLDFLNTVLSATDKNVVLDQTLLKSNASFEKAVRCVLSDVGRTRKHVRSFDVLTGLKDDYEVAVKGHTEYMQTQQTHLDRCHNQISEILNHRLPLVNQRIFQTESAIAHQCLQSILDDPIAPALNKFS